MIRKVDCINGIVHPSSSTCIVKFRIMERITGQTSNSYCCLDPEALNDDEVVVDGICRLIDFNNFSTFN